MREHGQCEELCNHTDSKPFTSSESASSQSSSLARHFARTAGQALRTEHVLHQRQACRRVLLVAPLENSGGRSCQAVRVRRALRARRTRDHPAPDPHGRCDAAIVKWNESLSRASAGDDLSAVALKPVCPDICSEETASRALAGEQRHHSRIALMRVLCLAGGRRSRSSCRVCIAHTETSRWP